MDPPFGYHFGTSTSSPLVRLCRHTWPSLTREKSTEWPDVVSKSNTPNLLCPFQWYFIGMSVGGCGINSLGHGRWKKDKGEVEYWRLLLGWVKPRAGEGRARADARRCSLVWFLYRAVVYPFNLLAPAIVAGSATHQTVLQSNGWSALYNAFALPGAIVGS